MCASPAGRREKRTTALLKTGSVEMGLVVLSHIFIRENEKRDSLVRVILAKREYRAPEFLEGCDASYQVNYQLYHIFLCNAGEFHPE